MNEINNVLFLNFGGIGDEILFLPTIVGIKQKYPNAKITLALEPRSKSIQSLSKIIDNIITVDIKSNRKYFELLKFVFSARKEQFDLVISSGANVFIPILLFLTGIPIRYGYYSGKLSELLLTKAIKLNKKQYAGKMYYDLVQNVTDSEFELPKIEVKNSKKELNSVLIHPGVSKMSVQKKIIKNFAPEIWSDLIKKLIEKGKKVYLAGGPDDADTIEIIMHSLGDYNNNANFVNLYGKTKNIIELAQYIKKSEILVCTDSAPMHIGIAVGNRTYAIFGPTDEKKLIPQNEQFTAITKNIDCRPCLWDKRQISCGKLDCLKFTADEILNKIM